MLAPCGTGMLPPFFLMSRVSLFALPARKIRTNLMNNSNLPEVKGREEEEADPAQEERKTQDVNSGQQSLKES